jgi:hypothetical protein
MYFQMTQGQLTEIWGLWKTLVVPERNKLGTSTLRDFVEDMVANRTQSKKLKS